MIRSLWIIWRTWSRSNELERWRIIVQTSRWYYQNNSSKINSQYTREFMDSLKSNINKTKFSSDEDHWTYLPGGSQYEN